MAGLTALGETGLGESKLLSRGDESTPVSDLTLNFTLSVETQVTNNLEAETQIERNQSVETQKTFDLSVT